MRIDFSDLQRLFEAMKSKTSSSSRHWRRQPREKVGMDDFFKAYVMMSKLIDEEKKKEEELKKKEKEAAKPKAPDKKGDMIGFMMFLMVITPIVGLGIFGYIFLTIAEMFSKMPK